MTVAVQTPTISYTEDGTTTAFPAPFRYDNPADLRATRVLANGTTIELTNGTAFTATPGPTNAGGTLTLTTAGPAGAKLTIFRRTTRSQTADYITTGAFTAESHERALDKAMLVAQEQDADLARGIKVAAGETAPTLPPAISRAGKLFAFDLVGNPTFDIDAEAVRNLAGGLTVTTASSGSIFASLGLLLAVASPVNGQSAIVAEDDVLGIWKYKTGNFTALITADEEKALYAAPASDPTGANGMWYRVIPFRGEYMADWWLKGNYSLVQDKINRAFKLMPEGAKLRAPPVTMTLQRAAAGTVTPGSSTVNGGIFGGIYIEKDGQELIGCGRQTVFDGQGARMNLIIMRANNCAVRHLRGRNAAGDNGTSESTGASLQPKLTGGAHLRGCTVMDCWFDTLDTGVGATSEANLTSSPRQMWIASGLKIVRVHVSGIRRQGFELFNCDDSSITECSFAGADRGAFTFSRFVRVIGSRNVRIYCNKATGFDPTYSGYFGVSVETSGFYGLPEFYRISAEVQIFSNTIDNFGTTLELIDSQGAVQFHDNIVLGPQQSTATTTGIRISSTGIRTPGFGSQTLTGSITRTDGHGLTTGTAIWSMQNFNGFTFGTTYYAIVLDANRFQWATSPSNAAAGTFQAFTDTQQMIWLRETDVLGLPNKNVIESLSVKANHFIGVSRMVAAQGRVALLTIDDDNKWIANKSTSAGGIDLTMIGSHPFENIEQGKIEGNLLLGNDVSNAPAINIGGMKAGSSITADDNKLTASANGATIIHSGPGELRMRNRVSNRIIPRDVWTQNFNPPAGNIFTGN